MIVLDTNIISEMFRSKPDPGVIEWLETLTEDVAITTITLAELLAGVLVFYEDAAEEYAEVLCARDDQAGLPISAPDAQIAAICRAHDAICATRNEKVFAETGVRVLNPWTR